MKTNNWYEDAMELEPRLMSVMPQSKVIADILFAEVSPKLTNTKEKHLYKDALKLILLNLYVAWCFIKSVRYSRNKNDYRHDKRYGLLYFKRDRILPIVDALLELGYIQQSIGHYYAKRGTGRQTRIWATEKLILLFQVNAFDHPGIIQRAQPEEIIQLKDDKKMLIGYSDESFINDMRNNLEDYNNFISQQEITVEIPSGVEVNQGYLNKLHRYSLTGVVEINQVQQNKYNINSTVSHSTGSHIVDTDIVQYNPSIEYHYNTDNLYTMTNPIRSSYNVAQDNPWNSYHNIPDWYKPDSIYSNRINTQYLTDYYNRDNTNIFNAILESRGSENRTIKEPISQFGIQSITYSSKYNKLHRVFNEGSFEEGGRFYGSYHLEMPKELRKFIRINGNPTVELDYSAHHIRMLYHKEGLQYTDDPYSLLCQDQSERIIHKLANLVAINAENEKEAVKGLRQKLRQAGIYYDLTNKALMRLICDFREAHKPIAEYLCSGIGRTLQNKDSRITEAILTRLMEGNIPCLPVHDSYIVEIQHKDTLYQVMMEEYEKVMGFLPQIGKELSIEAN
jgi:hypothetical protein